MHEDNSKKPVLGYGRSVYKLGGTGRIRVEFREKIQ